MPWTRSTRSELAGALLWSVLPVAVEAASPGLPALLQATLTTTASLLLLWLWTRWRGIAVFAQDATLAPGLRLGLLFSLRIALLYLAVVRIGAVDAVELSAGTLLLLAALARRRARALPAALLALAALGVLAPAVEWPGASLAVLAALAWGAQEWAAADSRLAACGGEKFIIYQLIGAAVILPVASVVAGENWLVRPGAVAWWALAAQLGCCVLALSLLWIAPRDGLRRGPSAASLPLAAGAALALQALLDHPARWVCWGGLALLLGGAAWLQGPLRDPGAPAWE